MTKVRDNPLAIQENDGTAPTNAYATLAATISSQGALATLNSVSQSTVDANAIGQSELKDSTGTVSASGTGTILTLAGGSYGFYPQIRTGAAVAYYITAGMVDSVSGDSTPATVYNAYNIGTSYLTRISLSTNGSTINAVQRYFTASKPYNLGDGEVGRFIFAIINNATREVESVYQATEAPWHYNGKTDIRGKTGKDGKKYRLRKDMSVIPFSFESAIGDAVKMQEYIDAFSSAKTTNELITQEICQRDMPDIPHPFTGNDLTGKTVVMLDPVSDLNHRLSEMCSCHDEFDLNSLLHDGHLVINNTKLKRSGPQDILIPSFKWKNTK